MAASFFTIMHKLIFIIKVLPSESENFKAGSICWTHTFTHKRRAHLYGFCFISYYDKSGVILQGNKNFNKATFVKIKTFGSKIL